MSRAALSGPALAILLMLAPGIAAAQDLCRGQAECTQGGPEAAGRDAEGRPLSVIRVTIPSPVSADGSPDCSGPVESFWLRRGAARPALVGRACANVGVSEGFETTVGPNRLTIAFAGPGGSTHTDYVTTYRLSPLRVEAVQLCASSSGEASRFVLTRLAAETLTGEALARVGPPGRGESSDDIGCSPADANQAWLALPRIALDDAALQRSGAGLGSCAAVMGATGGYVLAGARPEGIEVRLLATGPRRFLLQTTGALPTGARLDVLTSDAPLTAPDAAREGEVLVVRMDPSNGAVERGSGQGALPQARRWSATLPDGRRASLVALHYPEAEMPGLDLNLTIRLRIVADGRPPIVLSTSRRPGQAASDLGQSFDVAPFTRCTVRRGVLDVTRSGVLTAPFEANEAGGLRILR